jgi:predicted transcriptional regulator
MSTPRQPNEAARLTQELIDAGYTRKQVAQILDRDASLISQFFTKGKGGSFVQALRQITAAVQGGIRDLEDLQAIARQNTSRRLTSDGRRARVRGKDILRTPGKSVAARAGRQALAHGAGHLAEVIHETAANGGQTTETCGRLAFTVRMRKRHFTLPAGSEDDSPGKRRGVVPRADGTEERSYGTKTTGGMDAREWSTRVATARGDVTRAVLDWLIENGRATPDAEISYLEIRGWIPRTR